MFEKDKEVAEMVVQGFESSIDTSVKIIDNVINNLENMYSEISLSLYGKVEKEQS
jgi:predicted nuclease of restriction endonuclease-like RecB superfamily